LEGREIAKKLFWLLTAIILYLSYFLNLSSRIDVIWGKYVQGLADGLILIISFLIAIVYIGPFFNINVIITDKKENISSVKIRDKKSPQKLLSSNAIIDSNSTTKQIRKERIKEQLEGFYSPAMAWIDKFNITDEHFTNSERRRMSKFFEQNEYKSGIWIFIQDARNRYQFLAEPNLKPKLIKYYEEREKPPYDEHGNQIYKKELEFRGLLTEIQAMIKSDYKKLSDEYSELVNVK